MGSRVQAERYQVGWTEAGDECTYHASGPSQCAAAQDRYYLSAVHTLGIYALELRPDRSEKTKAQCILIHFRFPHVCKVHPSRVLIHCDTQE